MRITQAVVAIVVTTDSCFGLTRMTVGLHVYVCVTCLKLNLSYLKVYCAEIYKMSASAQQQTNVWSRISQL